MGDVFQPPPMEYASPCQTRYPYAAWVLPAVWACALAWVPAGVLRDEVQSLGAS